ncbi:MotA/TolQ/ExbB proton channel family protein [Roseiconus nitratireducens]|uniref:MotA/TolQ/ExbB proton channel family protein n=1 Tax=Roseiconus nitratireducens TaxID=2605748 RepID=UPI001375B172|nr:MotA/TolQ/ExbB proton channel family protein [Roseiconus nitratireducens]
MSKSASQNAGNSDRPADRPPEPHPGNTAGTESGPRDDVGQVRSDQAGGVFAVAAGGLLTAGFYAAVVFSGWPPLQRYFLGHPVAVAATLLFCVAVSILGFKHLFLRSQWSLLRALDDQTLAPRSGSESPSDRFRGRHDAGYVAQKWLQDLAAAPGVHQASKLVQRLREVLWRQSGRGTTKHLSDDLRELSSRDADAAHDSFALIRIIVWAIPMLGFLGTVIGITQTLGGLDFTNGNAAVDNLKSGLYVAFDTTALGLVLSVIAIFLQFPVEKSEQQLLAVIDDRVGHLTSVHLPGDEPADNQFELLAHLCEGVRAAVAESLDNQARLWRETIDEAQGYWQQTHHSQAESIITVVQETLAPALREHADRIELTTENNQNQLNAHFDRWQSQLNSWQQSIIAGAESMTEHQALMLDQVDQAALVREQVESVLNLQQTLAANLDVLDETSRRLDENLGAAAGRGMADAMLVLARAVDILTRQMNESRSESGVSQRHAA